MRIRNLHAAGRAVWPAARGCAPILLLACTLLGGCAPAPISTLAGEAQWQSLACGDRLLEVAYRPGAVWLREGGQPRRLEIAAAASGARYLARDDGPEIELWSKGGQTRLRRGDAAAVDCEPAAELPWRPLSCASFEAQVAFASDHAWLRQGDRLARLDAVETEAGTRFEGRWGGEALALERLGRQINLMDGTRGPTACLSMPDYLAHGNEPFWSVEQYGDVLEFSRLGGPPWAARVREVRDAEARTRLLAARAELQLELGLSPEICRDSMSGMPYPDAVELRLGDATLQGCGGEPATLLRGRRWSLASAPDAASTAHLHFAADSSLSLETACGRRQGHWRLHGEGLWLVFADSKAGLCPEHDARAERRLLQRLTDVRRHDFDKDGALVLIGADESRLRLPPALQTPPAG